MGFGLYPQEQLEYIKSLHTWKDVDKKRSIHVICGDIHHAMRTVIRDSNGNCVLNQTVTTAISNNPPPSFISCCISLCCMGWCCNNLNDGYSFKHTFRKYERNFAIIQCESDDESKWTQDVSIVTATKTYK